ncbi:MAG: hypothetical protein NT022_00235 [Deltaproteobacteria bacterium]|nr:hypothetical protein [Deltaproteobacteria bacterium]
MKNLILLDNYRRQRDSRGQVFWNGPRDPEEEGKGPKGNRGDEERVEPDSDA